MTDVRVLERVLRHAPVGIRLRDVATGQDVRDGLDVTLAPEANPARRTALDVNPSGIWYASRLPGLPDLPLLPASPPDADPFWSQPRRRFRLEVVDTLGRYLPLVTTVELPGRGILRWPGWTDLPLPPTAAFASPPLEQSDAALPLFSAPSRGLPGAMAEMHMQLAIEPSGAPAAWALVMASNAGRLCGIGMADASGRVALFFAYPPRPRSLLPSSPPAPTLFDWPIGLTAHWDGLDPSVTPDLADFMAQRASARDLYQSTLSPPQLLPDQSLQFGKSLTVRTAQTPDGPSSLLMMAAA